MVIGYLIEGHKIKTLDINGVLFYLSGDLHVVRNLSGSVKSTESLGFFLVISCIQLYLNVLISQEFFLINFSLSQFLKEEPLQKPVVKCLRENKYVYIINRNIFTIYGFWLYDTIFIYNLHLNVCEWCLTFYFSGARRKDIRNIILSIFWNGRAHAYTK